jgi:hypothetical protein
MENWEWSKAAERILVAFSIPYSLFPFPVYQNFKPASRAASANAWMRPW